VIDILASRLRWWSRDPQQSGAPVGGRRGRSLCHCLEMASQTEKMPSPTVPIKHAVYILLCWELTWILCPKEGRQD